MLNKTSGALADINDIWVKNTKLPSWFTRALEVPREDGFFNIKGKKTRYYRWGKRGNPPLLMTHGFLAHARCFAFIAPFLAEDYDIVAFDMPGMGESEAIPAITRKARGDHMVAVADAADLFGGPVKPIIVAHSFGASVGVTTMEDHGDKFGGLIICDMMVIRREVLEAQFARGEGGPPGSGNPDRPNRIYPDYETARSRYILSPPQEVGTPFLMDYMAYHSLEQVDHGEEQGWRWKFDPEVFRRDPAEHDGWLDSAQRVAALTDRKAIIYGEQSQLFPPDSVNYVREQGGGYFPIIGIPESRHHLMLDEPLAFVSALRSVLACWHTGAD